jgi:hypothetical protein
MTDGEQLCPKEALRAGIDSDKIQNGETQNAGEP